MLSRHYVLVIVLWKALHFRNLHHVSLLGVPCCCHKCTSMAGLGIITSLLTISKQQLHASLPKCKDKLYGRVAYFSQLEQEWENTERVLDSPDRAKSYLDTFSRRWKPKGQLTYPQWPTIYLDVRKAKCISFMQASITPLAVPYLLGQGLRTKASN